jgi:ABC-type dipeptide/oligopeptide/nickel transport system permease component
MFGFVARRMAQAVVVVLIVSFTVFLLARATGDPTNLLLPLDAPEVQKQEYRERWGLDEPLFVQFGQWLVNVAGGDLGTSFRARTPVLDLLMERLPRSFYLAACALAVAAFVGITTGVVAALKRGTWIDRLFRFIAIIGQGVPAFWLALLLQAVFAVRLPIFPVGGAEHPLAVVLPAVTLGWFISAGIMRLVRSGMLGALTSDYVLLARSKGVSEWFVVLKHGLRNALVAPITFLGVYIGILIGSAVVVEVIYAWPGIGSLAYQAVLYRDFPTLQAVILVVTVIIVLSSLLIDLLYALIDPRIRG